MSDPLNRFGEDFLRLVLHRQRVTDSIDRVLGETFELGPIGAGPGRKVASITARGRYRPSYGHELEGGSGGYRVFVPLAVDFDLRLPVDQMHFAADVVLPLGVHMRLEDPLTIIWDIEPPTEDDVQIEVRADNRRAGLLQRLAGIDDELRRFVVRFVARELGKPHVVRARRIELVPLIDAAWPVIAAQFLPNSPEDRLGPPPPLDR